MPPLTEEQKDKAKRGALAAGGVAGLGTAGYGLSLAGSGHTGIKNARYDIKNVRADRPANAKLRLKAAGRVVRNGVKLKRTGALLGVAGLAGAGAAGHKLHQEYAGRTLAKMPRHPVQKGLTAGQMSILRQQGIDALVVSKGLGGSKYLNPKHVEAIIHGSGTARGEDFSLGVNTYERVGRARNAFYNPKHTRVGRRDTIKNGGETQEQYGPEHHRGKLRPAGWAALGGAGATAGGTAIGYQQGKKSKVAKGLGGKYLNPKHVEMVMHGAGNSDATAITGQIYRRTGRARNVFYNPKHTREGSKVTMRGDGEPDIAEPLATHHRGKLRPAGWAALGGTAVGGAGATAIHQQRQKKVSKGYTAGQMSILRQQGLDPISKANFFDYIHSGAGAIAAGVGVNDAKKKRKRRKVEKADKRKDASGAVITGAGGAAAATGLVGGGIPGTRPHVPHGQTEGSRAKKMKATFGSVKGGIFGFRTEAHRNFLGEQEAKDAAYEGKHNSRADNFKRGLNAGKIEPEKQIIRHMRGGRIGSNVALVGGGAAAAYGVHRMRHPKKKVSKAQKDTDRGFGAALGAGGVAAVGSEGGARLLEHQGRKWGDRAASSLDEAGRVVPKTGGHTSDGRSANHRVRDVRPKVQPGKIARDPESFLRGKSSAKAHAAGALHGAAAQQRHFAGVYGHMANQIRQVRNPAIGVAAVGGGGLLVSRHLNKKKVEKSLVNGKWLKSSQALHAYKQGQKVGGYTGGKTPGITPAHAEIKEMTEAGAGWMKKVQQNPQESHSTLGMLGLHGLAVRTGGKSSGKSTVLINPQAIARNSKGKRDYRKNKKMVLTHEHAHAEPKRTQYRSHQLNANEGKMGREEGRADYLSQGHYSGYKSPIERSYVDNAPSKEFGAAYRSVQDKMHQAGTKVRKSFPVNHA